MSTPIAFPDPDEVLGQLDWVRGLAQKLVGDPAEAEDLRQEVWILSQRLQKPGQAALRGWLRGILRNVIRDRRRAARTRIDHETRSVVERARSLENPVVVREVSMHQLVVGRLMKMREPYRATLLARYFEDLSHGEIAERDEVSIATVRSRLQRGLAELRRDLDEERYHNSSLLALLALHTWKAEELAALPAVTTAGPPATGAGMAWIALGVAALGTALFFKFKAPTSSAHAELRPEIQEPEFAGGKTAETTGAPSVERSQRRAIPPSASAATDLPDSPASSVLVQVIGLDEEPQEGVELAYLRFLPGGGEERGDSVFTDAEGQARLVGVEGKGVEGKGIVICSLTERIQLAFPNVDETLPETEAAVVVLAPVTVLEGNCRAEDETPLAGVKVRLAYLNAFPGAIGTHLAHANQKSFEAVTDEAGHFQVRVPLSTEPMGLLSTRVGYEDTILPRLVFDSEPTPLEIILPAIRDTNTCFGQVVSDDGQPLVDAWVGDGERVVRTAAEGAFQLGRVPAGADLWVGAPGHEPRRVPRAADLRGVTLELSRPALSIQGRVTYPDGSPAAGLQLRLPKPQPAGTHYFAYGGRQAFSAMSVEGFAYPTQGTIPGQPRTLTSPDGTFELVGLLPRDYEIELFDPNSLQIVEGLYFAAGATGVRIECPAQPAAVTGTLKAPDGKPLAGVLLRSMEPAIDRPGPQARTDAKGKFRFESLAKGCRLWADVDLPLIHTGVVVGEGALELEAEPAARVRLTLDLREGFAGQERVPDELFFHDETGARVSFVLDDIRFYRRDRLPLSAEDDGYARPVPLLVPLRARELVLDGDGPILVLPLDLEAGQTVSILE